MKYKLIELYPGSPPLGTVVLDGFPDIEYFPKFWLPEDEWPEDNCWYSLIKPFPNRKIGDLARFVFMEDDFYFVWDSDKQKIPNEFYPESEWFIQDKEPMSKFTNSWKGSTHWLNTILGKYLRYGEYLTRKVPEESVCKVWGESLMEESKEIMEYFNNKLK